MISCIPSCGLQQGRAVRSRKTHDVARMVPEFRAHEVDNRRSLRSKADVILEPDNAQFVHLLEQRRGIFSHVTVITHSRPLEALSVAVEAMHGRLDKDVGGVRSVHKGPEEGQLGRWMQSHPIDLFHVTLKHGSAAGKNA